jgi:hypothetical protein
VSPKPLEPHEVPPGTPDRIAAMMTSGKAEPVKADPSKVSALWGKAVKALHSSSVSGLDADTAVDAAYKSLLQAGLALLESEGYRVGGSGGGHHEQTFRAIGGLGYAALANIDVDTDFVRRLRIRAVYEPDEADPADVVRIQTLATRLLPAIRAAIVARHARSIHDWRRFRRSRTNA